MNIMTIMILWCNDYDDDDDDAVDYDDHDYADLFWFFLWLNSFDHAAS